MNAMKFRRAARPYRLWPVAVLLLATAGFAGARADLTPELYYGTTIENASVGASEIGGTSELRVRIVNEGTEPLIFLGVRSKHIAGSRILARTHRESLEVLESVQIPVEEALKLDSSHLTVELSGLKTPFRPGQILALNLSFVRGEIPISVHVH